MIKVVFYCDIVSENGEVIDEDFDFDEGIFKSQEALDQYMKNCDYVIGECCGYWGSDEGILKEVITDEVVE
jgi:hypothetical protein